jgi:hypothetical protein
MKGRLERILVLVLALPILFVAGCGKGPPRALHTVNYYVNNEADRRARLEECRKDLARTRDNPDCINANQAETRVASAAN